MNRLEIEPFGAPESYVGPPEPPMPETDEALISYQAEMRTESHTQYLDWLADAVADHTYAVAHQLPGIADAEAEVERLARLAIRHGATTEQVAETIREGVRI